MPRILEKVKESLKAGGTEGKYATDVIEAVAALQQRINQLEAALIMLVRTGGHYENQGIEDDGGILRDSFAAALKEARTLLGLEHRSVLTRTEPRT